MPAPSLVSSHEIILVSLLVRELSINEYHSQVKAGETGIKI